MKKIFSVIIAVLSAFLPIILTFAFQGEQGINQPFSINNIDETNTFVYSGVQFNSSCFDNDSSSIYLCGISKDVSEYGFINSMGIVKKVKNDGTEEWNDCIGGNETTDITDITVLNDGSVIAVGYTVASHFYDIIDLDKTKVNSFIIKYDENGNRKWIKLIEGTGGNTVYSVAAASDGGFYVGGDSKSSDGLFSSFSGEIKAFVFKYTSNGSYANGYVLSCSKANSVRDICVNGNGEVLSLFQTTSNKGSYSEIKGLNDDVKSTVVVKLTSDLHPIWQRGISDGYAVDMATITYTDDGGCILGGRCRIMNKVNKKALKDIQFIGVPGTDEGLIIRINGDSSIGTVKPISGSGNDYVTDISRTASGTQFIISGYSESCDNDFEFFEDSFDGSGFGFVFSVNSLLDISESTKTAINGSQVDIPKSILVSDFNKTEFNNLMSNGKSALPIDKLIFVSGSTQSTDGNFEGNANSDESPFLSKFRFDIEAGNEEKLNEFLSGNHVHQYNLLKEDKSDCSNNTRTYICECGCGYMESVGKGHTLVKEIITKPGCTTYGQKRIYCTVCDYETIEKINPNDHTMTDWVTTDEPGKFKNGKRERECCFCIYKETEILPFTADKLQISSTEMTLDYKKTAVLSTDADTVTWSSSNPKAVQVSTRGEITAVGKGEADITAKNETTGLTATCHVNVYMTFWQRIIWAIKSFFGLV